MDVGYDKDGKRKKKGVGGFRTKKEAEEAAAQLLLELKSGTYTEESDISFCDFSQTWLDDYKLSGVKKGTVNIRRTELSHLIKYFNKISIKDITRKQYQDALYDLLEKGYAEKTIEGIHCVGVMIFDKAMELKAIKENPTQYARAPRRYLTLAEADELDKKEEIPKFLEKEELEQFLKTAKHMGLKDDYTIFLTLAYTGLRVGELCALRDINIDIQECTLSVTRTYFNERSNIKKYELTSPKTIASRRKMKISKKVVDQLENLIKIQEMAKEKHKEKWHDKGFIFCAPNFLGYPLDPKLIGLRMTRLLKLSGLNEKLTPHSLRHTHTSLLAEAGVSLEAIMERLGHENDKITRKIYLHVTKAVKKEAVEKFDKLMDSL